VRQVVRWEGLPSCSLGRVPLAGLIPGSTGVAITGPLRPWPYFSLIYLVAGQLEYSDARRRRILGVGDAFLLVPEVPHRFVPHRCAAFAEIFVSFEGPVFDALRAAKVLDAERPFYRLEPVALWTRRFSEFHRIEVRGESASVRRIGELVHLITDMAAAREGVAVDADAAWLERARVALAAAELRHAPEQVAAAMGMTHARFRKRFARLAGTPPARWRLRHAIEQAAALLLAGDASVAEVAERVGFADAFGFSRRFHAMMGRSPTDFRRADTR
jgi:AraC-like DNA-binding protein